MLEAIQQNGPSLRIFFVIAGIVAFSQRTYTYSKSKKEEKFGLNVALVDNKDTRTTASNVVLVFIINFKHVWPGIHLN